MSKHPGTSGLMPVKGSTCGIRPDLDAMNEDTGFDFSQAQQLLQQQPEADSTSTSAASAEEPSPAQTPQDEQNSSR